MAVKTGSTAELRFEGAAIGKVRDVSLTIVRDALETTGIGQKDRTYAYGVRGTTGTGTLLYDSANAATTATMNRLLNDSEATDTIAMVLDTNVAEGTLSGEALITQAGVSVSVGSVVSVPISFSFSGKPSGNF